MCPPHSDQTPPSEDDNPCCLECSPGVVCVCVCVCVCIVCVCVHCGDVSITKGRNIPRPLPDFLYSCERKSGSGLGTRLVKGVCAMWRVYADM